MTFVWQQTWLYDRIGDPTPRPPGEDGDPPLPGGEGDGSRASVPGASTSATATMEGAGIFLRFPGQWDDSSFRSHGLRGGLYYNVHRYYLPETGRYTRPDPLGLRGGLHLFNYAFSSPLAFIDPLGLETVHPCAFTWVSILGGVGDINNQAVFCAPCGCGKRKSVSARLLGESLPPAGIEPPISIARPSSPRLPFTTHGNCRCADADRVYVNIQTRRSLLPQQFTGTAFRIVLDYECEQP
jgi:RHS repeat-associated protein